MVVQSSYPELVVPRINFAEYMLSRFSEFSNRTALISAHDGQKYSFFKLKLEIRKMISHLRKVGIEKRDVVALCVPNCPQFVIVYVATAACGGIVTTCNPLCTENEIRNQMIDSRPSLIFAVPENCERIKSATSDLPYVKEIIVVGKKSGFTSFHDIVTTNNLEVGFDLTSGHVITGEVDIYEDVLVLPYSSGTTGRPKGVMISHFNFVASLTICRVNWTSLPHHVLYLVLPLFHIFGMLKIFSCLDQGTAVVLEQRFSLDKLGKAVETFKVTSCPLVPPMLLQLAKSNLNKKFDMTSLRTITVGAAPISHDLTETVSHNYNCMINQAWGLTETCGVPVVHSPMHLGIPQHCSGIVCPLNEIKICDVETGHDLGMNSTGEILVKGPEVMMGYWKNEEATAATITEDGFLRTGDLGYHDNHKRVYVVDRLKELIKFNAFQVAPAELEAILLSHADIADAAVIGVADEQAGELPKAFVVKRNHNLTVAEVLSFVEGQVSSYKRLRGGVEFVTEIPKSASGKILRRVLREREKLSRVAKL